MNARRENQIAWMLVLGVAIILAGGVVSVLAFGSATSLQSKSPLAFIVAGPIMILGGIALAGWGVFFGHLTNRRADSSGARFVPDCYVVGRYATNEHGEMLFDDLDMVDSPKAKFFVRLKTPDGSDEELECARELIGQIGEGMRGNAQIKGRWLGSFTTLPRP